MTIRSAAKNGISRRTVVVGTAWAVPAIVVASAAPALAASGPVSAVGNVCKLAGQGSTKQYTFQLTFNQAGVITINSASVNGVSLPASSVCKNNLAVQPNTVYTFIASGYPDQGNGQASINYTFTPTSGTQTSTDLTLNADGLPQLGSNNCDIPRDAPAATGCPIT